MAASNGSSGRSPAGRPGAGPGSRGRAEPPSRTPPPKPPRKPLWRRILRGIFLWGFGLILLLLAGTATAVFVTAQSLPGFEQLKSTQTGQTIEVRDRNGVELVSIGPSYGQWIAYGQIPTTMRDAIVSVEDRRFRSHFGIDPIGIVRSVYVRYQSGTFRQGASTITQQLARNVFLNSNRTWTRKIREQILAMALERKFSKDQILELYLNKVYFGGGAYGIDAASRKFFGHPGTELTLPESAIVAGLVKAPSHYSPSADEGAAKSRAGVVLQSMVEAQAITASQAQSANLAGVAFQHERGQNSVRYFTDWALPQLNQLIPDTTEPIEVWTTLDVNLQKTATSSLTANVPAGAQGALVSLDRDGAVLAMVGGTDYVTSNYNRATQAMRQPGSAWKLFVYLSALEAGYKPDDKVVDEPVTIQGWSPHNDSRTFAGQIDVRTAFAYSKNTVAAQLGNEVGFSTVAAMARRLGITTPINTMPSMVLGSADVHLIDMAHAFSVISAKGMSVQPYAIVKVATNSGRVLYQHDAQGSQTLIQPVVAAGITDLLQSTVAVGTGRAAQIGRPVAGKTGTTTGNKDGWFLGFSSGVTTGVWMGRDDAKPVPGLQGGHAPARAFADFMRVAVASRPVEPFDTQLKLPTEIEPDDEAMQSNPDDYYYVDDQGNLVPSGGGGGGAPNQGQQQQPVDAPRQYGRQGEDGDQGDERAPRVRMPPPAAVGPDFLDRATGGRRRGDQDPGLRQAPPVPSRGYGPRAAPQPDGY
jgi:penicillin-binding protein 1A